MAIVFVSPKKKISTVVWIIILILLSAFTVLSVIIFLPELKKRLNLAEPEEILAIPEIKVNFATIDADRVKNLDSFSQIATEFNYVAKDQNLQEAVGTIIAGSIAEATLQLQAMNLTIINIQPSNEGRSNPFASYYQSIEGANIRK